MFANVEQTERLTNGWQDAGLITGLRSRHKLKLVLNCNGASFVVKLIMHKPA